MKHHSVKNLPFPGKKAALVLSSGGARGLAQIGAIEVLRENGFEITSVAGASIGSLIGGLYAMGELEKYKKWVCTLKRMDVLNLMDFTVSGSGLLKAEKIFRTMQSIIPDREIADFPIPFTAVATDIISEQEIIFRHGSFYQAVRSSIAIPAIITPVKRNSSVLVDGGVLNPIPWQHVMRRPGDLLVVINLYGATPHEITHREKEIVNKISLSRKSNFFEDFHNSENVQMIKKWIAEFMSKGDQTSTGYLSLLNSVSKIMLIRIADLSLQICKPDILITIPQSSAGTWDFHKAPDLIKLGREAALKSVNCYANGQDVAEASTMQLPGC